MKVFILALRSVLSKAYRLETLLQDLIGQDIELDVSRLDLQLAINDFSQNTN